MPTPLVLLIEADPKRRADVAEAMERAHAQVLATGEAQAAWASLVSVQAVVLSLLPGGGGSAELVGAWRREAGRGRLPLLAIVPLGDSQLADAAVAAGADDILPWPASDRIVAARVGGVVRGARLEAEIAAFGQTLDSVVRVFEAREPHRIDHSVRVSDLASLLAQQAGVAAEEAARIRRAGMIFDIGTLAIPDAVLFKDTPLTFAELAQVRSHPVIGSEMLRGVPALEPFRPFVHRHHERLDGSGYPDGLRGSEIGLPIQILALADAYDGLTSARPYRPVRSHGSALEILWEETRKGLWDADLVRTLEKTLVEFGAAGETRPAEAK